MNQMPMLNQNLINNNVISPNYLNNLGPEGTLNLSDNQDIQNHEMEYMTDSDIEDPKYMPTGNIIQNDEKSMASVKNHLLTRVLGILLLFMLPTIVQVLLTAFGFYTSCDTQVFNAFIINTLKGVSVLC